MIGIGISWAICKSASRCSQITTPPPHHSLSNAKIIMHCVISDSFLFAAVHQKKQMNGSRLADIRYLQCE